MTKIGVVGEGVRTNDVMDDDKVGIIIKTGEIGAAWCYTVVGIVFSAAVDTVKADLVHISVVATISVAFGEAGVAVPNWVAIGVNRYSMVVVDELEVALTGVAGITV